MSNFNRILNRIVVVLTGVGCVAMVSMMMITVVNIFTRMFGKGILGTYEAVQLLIVVFVAFAIGYTATQDGHVNMDMIIKRLSKSTQRILYIITSFLTLIIWAGITWYTGEFAGQKLLISEHTSIAEYPVYPFRFIFAIGAGILCLVLVFKIIKAIKE